MDGEDIDVPEGTFDAVISRVGLIYFPNQQKRACRNEARPEAGRLVSAVADHPSSNLRSQIN